MQQQNLDKERGKGILGTETWNTELPGELQEVQYC